MAMAASVGTGRTRSLPGRRAAGRAAALALVALAALAAGCSSDVEGGGDKPAPTAAVEPAFGDTLIEASIADISGLIPNITSDGASHAIGNLLYSGLVKFDKDMNVVGDLAESWEFSKDCLDLTFRLRKNAKWHDGARVTAGDVLFTYETMIHPKTPTAYREDFESVKGVKVVDPYTIRVTYKHVYAKALQSWEMWMLPKHLLAPYVPDGRLREAPQNRNPVGSGPYRFQEWRTGEKVVVTASPDFYDGAPYISRIVYRVIPSQATIFLELKAEGVDSASLTAVQYQRQTDHDGFRRAFNKYRYPSNTYTYFGFNLRDPRFADRRVRQAFAHAIDKEAIIQGVRLGLAREATGPFKPDTWPYNPHVRRYPHDLARARALLAEAGWTDSNGDGILDRNGKPFRFEILTNQGNDERKKIAELIQASLKGVGVATEIRIVEWATFLKEHIEKRRFDTIILGWGIGPDPDQYEIWHSSKTAPNDLNHIAYANVEVDWLLEQGRKYCEQKDRVKHYHRLQEVLAEDQPLVFLYFPDALPVVASRVHGIVPSANGILHNFTKWFVPRHLQRYATD
jgi:peptide/nickel transport system substrate-binding protein